MTDHLRPAPVFRIHTLTLPELTARQVDVVRQLANGKQIDEIAGDLWLSHHTIRSHLRNAYERTGCSSQAALVAWCFRAGVIS